TQTKTYVDTVIQTTATAIMRTMQQYMDQQFEVQREWNSQCMDTINQRFIQLEQTSQQSNNNNHQNDDTNQTITNNQQGNMETDRDTGTSQGNYPLSSVINNLIIRTNLKSQNNGTTMNAGVTTYKVTARKFPTINYSIIKNMPTIQGFLNPKAAETERIRSWWVMNWKKGQKMIEMIPQKPTVTYKLWKALAFGSFVNLHEFIHKNLIDSAKEMNDDTTLETSDAFKAYMDAVLMLYENREQELNTYRDHINELCIKYEFTAVMEYDEDHRVALVTDRDSTLLDRNIEAEGKNFDVTTTRKTKDNGWRQPNWVNTYWQDGKEICLNWNCRTCPEDKNCETETIILQQMNNTAAA
ncbi:567_t:CDS:2, partial [Cetraspora pellucida]